MRDKEIHSLTLCSLQQHPMGYQCVFFVTEQALMWSPLLNILEAAAEATTPSLPPTVFGRAAERQGGLARASSDEAILHIRALNVCAFRVRGT